LYDKSGCSAVLHILNARLLFIALGVHLGVEISPKAPKISVVNVTYSCTYNSHWHFDFTWGYVHWTAVRSV